MVCLAPAPARAALARKIIRLRERTRSSARMRNSCRESLQARRRETMLKGINYE